MTAALPLTAILAGLVIAFTWLGRRAHRRLLASVRVVTLPAVASAALGNTRDVFVYLPPGYSAAPERRFPVLYLNDGQDRAVLKLHETLARLQTRGRMRPAIVVAVPTNDDRLREYGTAVAANAQGLGDRAAAYTAFVSGELMPLIEQRFRTCGRALIAGVSLGGLSAFDLAWGDADRFSAVGVMSGSFWWRSAADETAIAPGRRIAHQLVRQGQRQPGLRFWFQAGTRDEVSDRDGNGVIDAIQDTTELVNELVKLGYRPVQDVMYAEVSGGRHNYETWSEIFPDFLQWALGPGTPQPGCAA